MWKDLAHNNQHMAQLDMESVLRSHTHDGQPGVEHCKPTWWRSHLGSKSGIGLEPPFLAFFWSFFMAVVPFFMVYFFMALVPFFMALVPFMDTVVFMALVPLLESFFMAFLDSIIFMAFMAFMTFMELGMATQHWCKAV